MYTSGGWIPLRPYLFNIIHTLTSSQQQLPCFPFLGLVYFSVGMVNVLVSYCSLRLRFCGCEERKLIGTDYQVRYFTRGFADCASWLLGLRQQGSEFPLAQAASISVQAM